MDAAEEMEGCWGGRWRDRSGEFEGVGRETVNIAGSGEEGEGNWLEDMAENGESDGGPEEGVAAS